ncbi:hypothetical protein [Rhizobium sp. CC-YZS058]|uniref:hypothetical protein n=1 Tax=Rhizobium sp. CC-YZS058 TaxID=3042153 RepID=UPI002B053794|nr:hypothetical protein [Rhizobium sp. CC-YZS058]MEA3533540.1 hypothetical protein [Rhizobium sp. CC-YZS058]
MTPKDRNAAIAAAIILILFALGLLFLPTVVLFLGQTSPLLAATAGGLFILGFFVIFWLRARYQRRHPD